MWSRTTDLSLIRIAKPNCKTIPRKNPREYIELWYDEQKLKGIGGTTIYSYRQKIEALLGEYPKPAEFDIKHYLARKQELGACSGTIANYIKAYRVFFRFLYERGLYDFDPHCLKLPKIRYKERRVPSDEDVAKLLDAVNGEEDKVALLLLIDTGIRVTELATIKLKNINLGGASILINGKGDKTRLVYLSESTIEHLRAYVQTLSGEYLFPSTRADSNLNHRSRHCFRNRLYELCKRAEIEHISPHQLRHYFATYTLSHGGDVKAASELLGHADVGITLKIYHHVSSKAIREMHVEHSPLRKLEAVGALA